MRAYRRVISRTGAGLTAIALALAACLPSQAATSTGWRVVFQAHYGTQSSFNGLLSVAAPAKTSAWAVGGSNIGGQPGVPIAEEWNGTGWQAATLPTGLTGELVAVSAPTSTDVWAASFLNGYVLHWDGTAWSVAKNWSQGPHPLHGELTGVTAFSPSNVWVFGARSVDLGLGTWHLSGRTWHRVTGLAGRILTASALSPTNMWAISTLHNNNDSLVHYNGSAWRQVSSPALSGLQFHAILATSASDIWASAVTASGAAALVHFNGRQWQRVPVTLPKPVNGLTAIAPDGHGGLWFTGLSRSIQPPWAVHRSASGAWSASKLSAGDGVAEDVALIPGTGSLWASGSLEAASGGDAVVWGHGPGT